MNTSNNKRISRRMVEAFSGNEDYISSKLDILNYTRQEDALLKGFFTWAYFECPELLEPLGLNSYDIDSGSPYYHGWAETSYFLDIISRFGQSLSV